MQIGQFYKIAVAKETSSKMVGGLQDNGGQGLNNNIWQNYYGADGMDTAIDPYNSNLYYGLNCMSVIIMNFSVPTIQAVGLKGFKSGTISRTSVPDCEILRVLRPFMKNVKTSEYHKCRISAL